MTEEEPISYEALALKSPVCTASGTVFGEVEHVLQIPDLDLFDGIVVATSEGIRFVDADRVARITTRAVYCTISDADVADLPAPEGDAVFHADALEDTGSGLTGRLGRLFKRPHWKQDDE
ncbi:MAG: hypothetical protein ACRDPG_07285 [Nocardioidaceae bacterium]